MDHTKPLISTLESPSVPLVSSTETKPVESTTPAKDQVVKMDKVSSLKSGSPVVRTEKDNLLDKMTAILESVGGLESNVGITSEYWEYIRKYRALSTN